MPAVKRQKRPVKRVLKDLEGHTGRTRGSFCGEGTHEHRGGGFKEGPRGGGTKCAQRAGETVSGMKTTAGDSERGHKGRAVLALPWRRRVWDLKINSEQHLKVTINEDITFASPTNGIIIIDIISSSHIRGMTNKAPK
ncbi:hypothetical protein DPMN_078382 [Dreissena polymorpha]|uniref:Uncharacterized protein n=1 Tax=Dreissena polymorpha TaxID=45954 RepID=A0A9D3YMK6_DREPO|nr:hypothetical protein DPMN_078382 [Dreissena polymorpha]